AVEIDHVQEARPGVHPGTRGLERRVLVDGLLVEVALDQPDGLAVRDVDRRVEDHAASLVKFSGSASPSAEDFSGRNCTPKTLSRPTTVAKRSPYSPQPRTASVSGASACTRSTARA